MNALTLEEQAFHRVNMINGTLRPVGVDHEPILDAFYHVKRTPFVPQMYRDFAYSDRSFPLASGRMMSEPATVALLLMAANVQEGNRVLLPLAAPGYTLALLLSMGAEVMAVEPDPSLLTQTQSIIEKMGDFGEHATIVGANTPENIFNMPYDAIILETAEAETPPLFRKSLTKDGRVVCLTATNKAIRFAKLGLAEGHFATITSTLFSEEPRFLEDVPLITTPADACWWRALHQNPS